MFRGQPKGWLVLSGGAPLFTPLTIVLGVQKDTIGHLYRVICITFYFASKSPAQPPHTTPIKVMWVEIYI
jgi:hypothetical protein